MEDFSFEFDPLSFFNDLLDMLIQPFIDFILGFLPNGDPAIYSVIDGVGNVGADLTFNVFWFIDWSVVTPCLGVFVIVMIAVHSIKFVSAAIRFLINAVEAVPIVE